MIAHTPLKRARLPVPPRPLICVEKRGFSTARMIITSTYISVNKTLKISSFEPPRRVRVFFESQTHQISEQSENRKHDNNGDDDAKSRYRSFPSDSPRLAVDDKLVELAVIRK